MEFKAHRVDEINIERILRMKTLFFSTIEKDLHLLASHLFNQDEKILAISAEFLTDHYGKICPPHVDIEKTQFNHSTNRNINEIITAQKKEDKTNKILLNDIRQYLNNLYKTSQVDKEILYPVFEENEYAQLIFYITKHEVIDNLSVSNNTIFEKQENYLDKLEVINQNMYCYINSLFFSEQTEEVIFKRNKNTILIFDTEWNEKKVEINPKFKNIVNAFFEIINPGLSDFQLSREKDFGMGIHYKDFIFNNALLSHNLKDELNTYTEQFSLNQDTVMNRKNKKIVSRM